MEHSHSVVGFAGSLRRGSYNRALLRAAAELAQPALHISIYELSEIPLYMGASPGITGTAHGQAQLRQAFVATNTCVLLQPEVLVGRAHEKFDADGRLADEATRDLLVTLLQRFTELITLHAVTAAGITA